MLPILYSKKTNTIFFPCKIFLRTLLFRNAIYWVEVILQKDTTIISAEIVAVHTYYSHPSLGLLKGRQ